MKIENQELVVEIDGVTKRVPLPAVTDDAKVKVWRVPAKYRADGLFVAVTQTGEVEEVPACDLADTKYLGEIDLAAGVAAKLESAKAARRADINALCDAAVAALAADYPEREVLSWPQQVREAEALATDPLAATPLLTAIAEARSIPVDELAARVLANMKAFADASGALIGRRQAAGDSIDAAQSPEDVASIAW
jgi:hypothetical protein